MLYMHRDGVRIGRVPVRVAGIGKFGNHVFTMVAPAGGTTFDSLRKRTSFNEEFRSILQVIVAPGTTVLVTGLPVSEKRERGLNFFGK